MQSENTTNLEVVKLLEVFMECDDFCKALEQWRKEQGKAKACQSSDLHISEILTIIVYYHLSGYKCFKYYYQRLVLGEMKSYFPKVVTYHRFIELITKALPHLYLWMQYRTLLAQRTGLYLVDSKKLAVCHNLRIHSHKVFAYFAARGKSSSGWFYGLKLHLVINHLGEIVHFLLTPGNVADNNKAVLEQLLADLNGKCFGDKGYLSRFFAYFYEKGIQIITKIRANMKNKLMTFMDRLLLKKRGIIECVNDLLVRICDIEHSRHRSPFNAFAHILGGLIAYSFLDHKPALIIKKLIEA